MKRIVCFLLALALTASMASVALAGDQDYIAAPYR